MRTRQSRTLPGRFILGPFRDASGTLPEDPTWKTPKKIVEKGRTLPGRLSDPSGTLGVQRYERFRREVLKKHTWITWQGPWKGPGGGALSVLEGWGVS